VEKETGLASVFKDKCPECGSPDLIHDYGTSEDICGTCGVVIRDKEPDRTRPEWRAFTPEEIDQKAHAGLPSKISIHDQGMGTTIMPWEPDAQRQKTSVSTKIQMWRLRKRQIQARVHSSEDRNLALAFTEIDRLSDKLSLPKPVKEHASIIYRKALKKNLVQGRSIVGIAAAAVYIACRMLGIPRTHKEISRVSLVKKRNIAQRYRLLVDKLDLKMPIDYALIYISKIAQRAGISARAQELTIKIYYQVKEKKLISGKGPRGTAAAILYFTCKKIGEKKTQREIAEATGVTEVTVRNRFKELEKLEKRLELPD